MEDPNTPPKPDNSKNESDQSEQFSKLTEENFGAFVKAKKCQFPSQKLGECWQKLSNQLGEEIEKVLLRITKLDSVWEKKD